MNNNVVVRVNDYNSTINYLRIYVSVVLSFGFGVLKLFSSREMYC